MFEETKKHLGTVSLLVNNTGISQQKLFSDITEAEWDTMFSVNVKSMFLCCRQAIDGYDSQQKRKNHQYFFYVGTSRSILRSPLLRL